jgi:elongation factor P
MYNASDLRKGLKIELDGEPYVVTAFEFSKPGKGQALYRCKLKNMITGVIIDPTYRSGDTFKPADLSETEDAISYTTRMTNSGLWTWKTMSSMSP